MLPDERNWITQEFQLTAVPFQLLPMPQGSRLVSVHAGDSCVVLRALVPSANPGMTRRRIGVIGCHKDADLYPSSSPMVVGDAIAGGVRYFVFDLGEEYNDSSPLPTT